MATILGERKVIFFGLWRSKPRTDLDRQLRLISEDYREKPGLPASFQITQGGVELHIISDNGLSGKNIKIEHRDIYDVRVNNYHPKCLMVVYADAKNSHNFLVCECDSELDGIQLNKIYCDCKATYSNRSSIMSDASRQNWVLKQKFVSNNNDGKSQNLNSTDKSSNDVQRPNVLHATSSIDSSGYHSVEVHRSDPSGSDDQVSIDSQVTDSLPSQTENRIFDNESIVSMESYNSMKEELLNLSKEVRNIKSLLVQQGINLDKLSANNGPIIGHDESDSKNSPASSPTSGASDRRVNFAVGETKELVDTGRKGLYIKHQTMTNSRGKGHVRPNYLRTDSSGNSSSSPSAGYVGVNEVFDYPQRPVTVVTGPPIPRRGSQNSTVAGTVERPIERVYQMQPRQPHSTRRQIILHPGQSSTLPAFRRQAVTEKGITPILKNGHH